MSTIHIENIEFGVMKEVAENDDPILTASEVLKLGRFTMTPGGGPSHEVMTEPYWLNDSREPAGALLNTKMIQQNVLFEYLHSYPYYLFFGNMTDNTTYHTSSPLAKGSNKPSYTGRYKKVSAALTEVDHVSGSKIASLGVSCDYTQASGILKHQITSNSMDITDGSAQSPSITLPTGATNANYDILTTWTFGGTDISAELDGFDMVMIDTAQLLPPNINEFNPPTILHGDMLYTINIRMKAGKRTLLSDYFRDFDNDTVMSDVVIRHDQQGTDNYIQYNLTDLYPMGKPGRPAEHGKLNVDEYQFGFLQCSVDHKDGLTFGSYY